MKPDVFDGLDGASFVIGQLGQSLDGRIATPSGKSHYITGPESLVHLHRMRALVDAVVVGAGTVAADDPELTVRHVEGASPVRVVIDPTLRLAPSARVFQPGGPETLVIADAGSVETIGAAAVIGLPHERGGLAPQVILDALRARGLKRILVEGGANTLSRFLSAGLLDRLHIVVAPIILGSGPAGIVLPPIDTPDEALRPTVRTVPLGADILYDCAF